MKKKYLVILLFAIALPVLAVDFRQFSDPEKQKTYEIINSQLRCLVCQNQTIADSNAELAADLRRQVYEMLDQGKSKEDIIQFMTERYGDFVLYKPPLKAKTALLWLGPIGFLIMGLITVFFIIRRKKQAVSLPVDKTKQDKVRTLLETQTEHGEQP